MKRHIVVLAALLALAACFGGAFAEEPAKTKVGDTEVTRSGKTYFWVYLQENFKGKGIRVEVPIELANDARLKEHGIPNDSIMSMKVPDGVVVTLYDNAAYGGTNQAFTGKCPTLGAMKGLASSLKAEFKAQ
jgi:hypothetical protein